ncbi:MAG: ATP-dependent zinc metalloprotease FtsH [Oscillospiraceae bacterium]|nr:ATP-dependent zinc metalloprotease FtsH [Oscillospiraceae bacterium]
MLIPVLIIAGLSYYASFQKQEKLEYYEVVELFDEHKIEEYTLNMSSGNLKFKIKGEAKDRSFTVPNISMFQEDIHDGVIEYNRNLAEGQTPIKAKYQTGTAGMMLINIVPSLLMFIVLGGLLFFMFRRMNQTMSNETNRTLSFGKAKVKRAKDEKRKTTFDDVAGADEEKEELSEIVEFLKNPARFNSLGARIPRGVLLVGPPGTGKTLLARAVAGEADVPFFSISGSDFVEMYVGVGASRVRDLFSEAKKNSPSIIFIDEIDAVGRHRGAGMGGGHDEREQTLNQLLVEMDGFGANEGVIIIAATNRPDILDPALLRPGRFDRQVTVGYPDLKGREEILKVHAKGKPLAPDVKLSVIAQTTIGFTGADLENLLNEAALLAARRNKMAITMVEIEEAMIKVVAGTEKKSHKISDKEKKLTAYHEAGHAVSSFYLENKDPVHQVSIIPRGQMGGYTLYLPTEDTSYRSKNEMLDNLVSLLGGRVAEALVLGDISTGASNDIERATELARNMVTKYGMSDKLGPITFGSGNDEVFLGRDYSHMRNYSEETAADIDDEINRIITDAYNRTKDILTEHIDKLHVVAQALIEREKIDGDEFKILMEGGELPPVKAEEPEVISENSDETQETSEQTEVSCETEETVEQPSEDVTETEKDSE